MSDAIRCGQCRWWFREMPSDNCGWCELNPPIYVDVHGESGKLTSWSQPRTLPDEGCSRGSPKATPQTGEAILKDFADAMDERGFVAEDIKVMCDHLRSILQALTSPQPQTGERT